MDKNDYETKYKGKLTCIKGCKARIKFTERKNDIKFFSTWNKEGYLHDKGCSYYVEYKGKMGRKKLHAYYEAIELDDNSILKRLQWKMQSILNVYKEDDIEDPKKGSREIEDLGRNQVSVDKKGDNGNKSERIPNIKHEDANYITTDDIGHRKSVHGIDIFDNVGGN